MPCVAETAQCWGELAIISLGRLDKRLIKIEVGGGLDFPQVETGYHTLHTTCIVHHYHSTQKSACPMLNMDGATSNDNACIPLVSL